MNPDIYLFLGSNSPNKYKILLENKNIKGAQIIYSWKTLEPEKNHYNFTPVKNDLKFLESIHKKLFIQIQDKSFNVKNIPIPDYLQNKKYHYGIEKQVDFSGPEKSVGIGWVTKQWNPLVQKRFQKLIIALGKRFDGKIAGINLSETAIDISHSKINRKFCKAYFQSVLKNDFVLRSSFKKSIVVQYVNFFPCEWNNDHHYMSHIFSFAKKNNIGLGGPDVVPYRIGQMKNSYPFFHGYMKQLKSIAFAIQQPDYTYINPKTKHHFTPQELYSFAISYLGSTIIFWNIQQPEFSKYVLPMIQRVGNNN
jgi:hypothetical protein